MGDVISNDGGDFGLHARPTLDRDDPSGAFRQRARELGQLSAHFIGRQGKIDIAGGDCGVGHGWVLWAVPVGDLSERQTASLLDGLRPQGAVAIAARQHDRRGVVFLIDGQRAEQNVDRFAFAPAVVGFAQLQAPGVETYDRVGRQHVDAVRPDADAVLGDRHRQIGVTCDNLVQQAFAVRTEVSDDDERESGLGGNAVKKSLERLDPTR